MGLELVELVMDLEDHFAVGLPDAVVSNCNTVSDLHKAIVAVLLAKGVAPSAELDAQVYRDMPALISKQMRLAPAYIRPDSRLVGDIARNG